MDGSCSSVSYLTCFNNSCTTSSITTTDVSLEHKLCSSLKKLALFSFSRLWRTGIVRFRPTWVRIWNGSIPTSLPKMKNLNKRKNKRIRCQQLCCITTYKRRTEDSGGDLDCDKWKGRWMKLTTAESTKLSPDYWIGKLNSY